MYLTDIDFDTSAERFNAFVAAPDFPCVGAKSALARGTLKVVRCRAIDSAWDDVAIHRQLLDWGLSFDADTDGLRSLVFVFDGPAKIDEAAFERAMWARIQSLTDKDDWLGQRHDPTVSADPDSPHFSLSFGGRAYFVVGLHPGASRPARRFDRPAMVFNLHAQFARLRDEGRYERMRERIIARDVALAGDPNPMLAHHGDASEARQYSGRAVDTDWHCPFHRAGA